MKSFIETLYPVHPLNGALPRLYVPVRVTCGALVAHRYTNNNNNNNNNNVSGYQINFFLVTLLRTYSPRDIEFVTTQKFEKARKHYLCTALKT